MKSLTTIFTYFSLFISVCFAQHDNEKVDVILKLNGDKMLGKVTNMDDRTVDFVYKDETLTYHVLKADIQKITFSSGRIELINSTNAGNATASSDGSTTNKVAILPVGVIIDGYEGSSDLADKIQAECYQLLSKKSATLTYQQPSTTNALLIKNNVTHENIKGFTMDELCHLLGVEYVVQNVVTINKTSASTTTYSTGEREKDKGKKDKSWSDTFSTSSDNFSTGILMNIYDEHGAQLFTKDHQSLWPTQDAYKITLGYLAKKTPLFGK